MILDLVLIGLVITLEPLPLTAFILILLAKGGVRKGALFIFGWILSLAIVIAITILITGNKPPQPNTAPSLAASPSKSRSVSGCWPSPSDGAAGWGARKSRRRRRNGSPVWTTCPHGSSSGWLPCCNRGDWLRAGVATIVEAKLASAASYLAVILFCLISTSALLTMETYASLPP